MGSELTIDEEVTLTIMEAGMSIKKERIRKFKRILLDIEEFNKALIARSERITSLLRQTPAVLEKDENRAFYLLGGKLLFGVEAKRVQVEDGTIAYLLRTEPPILPYSLLVAGVPLFERAYLVSSWARITPVVSNVVVVVNGDVFLASTLLIEEWIASLPLFLANKYSILPFNEELLDIPPEPSNDKIYITRYGYSTVPLASSEYNIEVDFSDIPEVSPKDREIFNTNLYDAVAELVSTP